MIRIVDVFEGNGAVNWAAVKAAGITAAIHKATQYRVDHLFAQHHLGIPAAGMHHGCYHFLNWDVPIIGQVALYRNLVGVPSGPGHFPWVIDYEKYNGRLPTADQLEEFLDRLSAGPQTLLYGNRWDLANLGTRFNGRVKVWLAEYGPNNGAPNGDPQAMRTRTQFPPSDVVMWQYTSLGSVPGIGGNVDQSMWLGTDAEYAAYVGISQPLPEPPAKGVLVYRPPLQIGAHVTVSSMACPTGGAWELTQDGNVYAWGTAPDLGAPARHPEYWKPGQQAAELRPFGNGFTVLDTSGNHYDYPAKS